MKSSLLEEIVIENDRPQKMELKDLQNGDVLLFEADLADCISWAITYFSKAPVSHAAICYDAATATLVDAAGEYVRTADLKKYLQDNRPVHVCRLMPSLPMQPVLNAAKVHLDRRDPYANSTLWMVSLLILYENYHVTSFIQKKIAHLLELICGVLIQQINSKLYPGKTPMVCSQFVTQCYEESGVPYRLHFNRTVDTALCFDQSLLEFVRGFQEKEGFQEVSLNPIQTNSSNNLMDVACQLLRRCLETPKMERNEPAVPEPELITAVNKFCCLYQKATTLEEDSIASVGEAFEGLRRYQQYFITPGDLLLHCSSLEQVGILYP